MTAPVDGPAEQNPSTGALAGVRVLDLTRLLPGAYATLLLANLGADVVKIEDPRGGDGMRSLRPDSSGRNPYFDPLNRHKRSVTLDLRKPESSTVLDALAEQADVLIESFRPSTARRLHVDPDSMRARHPRLICASISGFGRSGPYVERAAHDINYQALAGLLRPPLLPGPLVGDIGSAMHAALQIVAALFHRVRTGQGTFIDISIHRSAIDWAMFPTTVDLASGCYNIYETADGQWLALGALESKFWARFCERIGRPDLIPLQHAPDPDRAQVVDEVRSVLRTRSRAEWIRLFEADDICLSMVSTPEEARADPHVRATLPSTPAAPGPALGADTDAVLEAAGITSDARAALRAAGVI